MGNWFSSAITQAFEEKGLYAYSINAGNNVQVIMVTPKHSDTIISGDVINSKAIFTIMKGKNKADNLGPVVISLKEPYESIIINEIIMETSTLTSSAIFEKKEDKVIKKELDKEDIKKINVTIDPADGFKSVLLELEKRWN